MDGVVCSKQTYMDAGTYLAALKALLQAALQLQFQVQFQVQCQYPHHKELKHRKDRSNGYCILTLKRLKTN